MCVDMIHVRGLQRRSSGIAVLYLDIVHCGHKITTFIVAPCVSNMKNFIVQLMQSFI